METPEVHAHHHGHGTGVRWVDLALGGSAMLVSIISLFVAVGHGRVMEKLVEENHRQVQASTWPFIHLDLTTSTPNGAIADAAPTVALAISNHGNGPARIQSLEVLIDGKPMQSQGALLKACCKQPGDGHAFYNNSRLDVVGTVLAQHEEQTVFSMAPVNGTARAMNRALVTALPRVQVKSCYCSVFDECWVASTDASPREVKACPTNIDNFRG
jgi:hypothetical protein